MYIHFLERCVALLDSVTCLVVVLGDSALGVNKTVNSPPSCEILWRRSDSAERNPVALNHFVLSSAATG